MYQSSQEAKNGKIAKINIFWKNFLHTTTEFCSKKNQETSILVLEANSMAFPILHIFRISVHCDIIYLLDILFPLSFRDCVIRD